ncbi:hypothetical protein WICPIJ_000784 [Wickerhamomyces pijperi]|uniref:Uncharacterized protein n=1 Tax=Wickerhamomyces pijperi TaxID=599730 RepID=A0A9P8TQI8_WICPI|nr:hypothetical protein WICPIJ_000784 [Wickerhamomyces pijperi]
MLGNRLGNVDGRRDNENLALCSGTLSKAISSRELMWTYNLPESENSGRSIGLAAAVVGLFDVVLLFFSIFNSSKDWVMAHSVSSFFD